MSCSKICITEIPISLRFKIPKEKLLNESQKEKWFIRSEKFNVQEFPGVSYFVGIVTAKSEDLRCGNYLFLFMNLYNEEKLNINVDFKISIPTANYVEKYGQIKEEKSHVHYNHIGQADELFDPTKNFIVNDSLVITMEAILNVQKEESIDTGLDLKESKCCECKLGVLLRECDDKDFTFIVEEKEIKVHKCVLGTKSLVFDRMIKSGLKESKESKVVITDFDFDIVEIGIKFCYGIKEQHHWNVETAIKLLQFSDKYDIKDLKTSTDTFLSSKISPTNVCKIANASILGNSIKLRQQCFEYFCECNQKKIFITDLELLDKDFAVEFMKASFSRFALLKD